MHRSVCKPCPLPCPILIPHIEIGDPVDDLAVATVLMVVGGQLILLRPRKVCCVPEKHA